MAYLLNKKTWESDMTYFIKEEKPESDPWKHRAVGMRCLTCMWFVEKEGQQQTNHRGQLGRCRRHAPSMNGFPAVFGMDWCGDHKMDETKI
jgi:hypothetical protein